MTNPSISDLLRQHFSMAELAVTPAPLQRILRMLGSWLALERNILTRPSHLSEILAQQAALGQALCAGIDLDLAPP